MYKDSNTTAINATVNQQLLENVGMETQSASLLAAAITALDSDYRLEAPDARIALRLEQLGTAIPTIAANLRPL